MLTDIDKRIFSSEIGFIPRIIEDLKNAQEPDLIPKIQALWRSIDLEDYPNNPAICASRFLDDGQHGEYRVMIGLPDGSTIYEDDLIRWTVAGRGTLRHDPKFVSKILSCENDIGHYLKVIPHHCGKLSCPTCSPYEISYNSTKTAIKLMTGAKYAERNNRADRVLQHITISPPQGLYFKFLTIDGFQEMKKYAVKVASDAGIKGGLIIFHPYRQNGINDDDDIPDDYTPTASNDGNKHHARFAPHFHVLGFGWLKPASREFMESHKGWLFKAIRTGKNRIKTITDVIGVINYLMSHAGLISEDSHAKMPRMKVISWIGLCNSHVLTYICDEKIGTEQLCEECGENIVIHAVKRYNDEVELKGNLYAYQTFPIYSDSAHKDAMRAYYEENKLDPVGILQYIEKNPQMGVCYLSSRELTRRLTQPTVIYARKDNTPHVPDVFACLSIPDGIVHKREKRIMEKTIRRNGEASGNDPVPSEDLPFFLDPEDYMHSELIPSLDLAMIRFKDGDYWRTEHERT